MKIHIAILLFIIVFTGCTPQKPTGVETERIDYQTYNYLLNEYVNAAGFVDYEGMLQEQSKLESFLNQMSYHPPSDQWTRNEKLAYWINAYNAFTLQLILNHYPVEGIKDIGPLLQIPYVNSVFDIRFININGVNLDLNFIEHQVLRKEFDEPRIHFAINCASVSCPPLRMEAYTANKLDQQLQEQANRFFQEPYNIITADQMKLSKIFKWFKGDFTKDGTLIDFVKPYTDEPIDESTAISYKDYNWGLNEQK